jgi:hypothetical protein
VQTIFWTKVFTTKNRTKRRHLLHRKSLLAISHLNNANPLWDDLKLKCHRANCSQILNLVMGFLTHMWEKIIAYKNYNQYNPYWCPKWNMKLIKSIDRSFTCLTFGHETIYGYEISQKPSLNSNLGMNFENLHILYFENVIWLSIHAFTYSSSNNNRKTTTTPK